MPVDSRAMETAPNPSDRARHEQVFTALLDSAYSLQQHQDRIRTKVPAAKFREIMDEMINTLSLIRSRNLDSDTAMQLVVNRTQKMVAAAGAAVAMLDGENLEYKVGTGLGAALLGLRIRAKSSLSFEQLGKESLTYAWEDTALQGRIMARILSVPLYRSGRLAGCIQLFSRTGHFDDHAVPVCELMSAIVSQSMGNAVPRPEETFARAIMAERQNGAHAERAPLTPTNGQSIKSRLDPHDASDRTKKGERQLNVGVNATRTDKPAGPSPDIPFRRSIGSLGQYTPPRPEQDMREDMPDLDKLMREAEETDWFRHRPAKVPSSLPRPPVVSPAAAHTLRLLRPEVKPDTQAEAPGSEIADPSSDVLADTKEPGTPTLDINGNTNAGMPDKEIWSRLKRMYYPVCVLAFAITVRVKAGSQSWPLEIAIYILLVITTLELVQRFSEP